MKLQNVMIENIKGIEYLEFHAGKLTVVSGGNGTGKSSVLDAISAVFDGGHTPDLLRQGEKRGEVIMTMDDGSTLEAVITEKTTTRPCKSANGELIPAPATYIATLAKGFAFDPLRFVHSGKKERAEYLSKVMPIEITAEQIVAACEEKRLRPQVAKLMQRPVHNIGTINDLRKRVYDDRAVLNRQIKIQDSGIDALRKTLPANWKPEGDFQAVMATAQTAVEAATKVVTWIKSQLATALADWDRIQDFDLAEITAWETGEVERIRREANGKREVMAHEGRGGRETLAHSMDAELSDAAGGVTYAREAQAVTAEQAKHFASQAQSAATIEQYQKDLRISRAEAELFDAAISAIDEAKTRALSTLPIPGLSNQDGEVMYQIEGMEPLSFDSLNTQLQYVIALRIAALGTGALGLMVIDNTEAIDDEHWGAFADACEETGLQIIAGRVRASTPLAVEVQ